MTVWAHLPSGLQCRLILEDAEGRAVAPEDWAPLEEFLPDEAGHSLAHLLLTAGDAQVEVECGGAGDIAACHIRTLQGDVQARWVVDGPQDGWQVTVDDRDVTVAPDGTTAPADIAAFLRDQREAARLNLPTGEGLLSDALEAMEATLAANTFMLPGTEQLITLSRHETEQAGAWQLPNWQTFLTALGIGYADPALALANCRTALQRLAAGDVLGALATAEGVRAEISHPPVASYCVWKLFQLTGDERLLEEAMPQLLRWHRWWREARDPNDNRILGWGSADETGMAAHPLYTEAERDEKSGVLQLDDAGLSSLWALDAVALMRMALHAGRQELATLLEEEVQEVAERMNLMLWDHTQGIYRSLDWDLQPTDCQSATALLALAAGIPTGIRTRRLVSEHLDFEFTAPFLVPSLGTGDAAYHEQQPWRGRVSPLLNFLICEGLRHFGEDAWAERISLSSLSLLRRNWRAMHRVFASYHAQSGRGDDIAQDPLAPAGILLGALGVGLLIDVEPWDGIRLGNLGGVEMALHGFPLRGDRYDLASGPWGFSARRNGKSWIEADRPVILRNLVQGEREISLHAKVSGGGRLQLRFFGYVPKETIAVKINGRLLSGTVAPTGELECSVDLPPAPDMGGPGMARVA